VFGLGWRARSRIQALTFFPFWTGYFAEKARGAITNAATAHAKHKRSHFFMRVHIEGPGMDQTRRGLILLSATISRSADFQSAVSPI
jgi:hypothetical protein